MDRRIVNCTTGVIASDLLSVASPAAIVIHHRRLDSPWSRQGIRRTHALPTVRYAPRPSASKFVARRLPSQNGLSFGGGRSFADRKRSRLIARRTEHMRSS
jgi:hypothetical protein